MSKRVYCVDVTVSVPVVAENDVEAEKVGVVHAKEELDAGPPRVRAHRCLAVSAVPGWTIDTIPWSEVPGADDTLGELLP